MTDDHDMAIKSAIGRFLCLMGRHRLAAGTRAVREGWPSVERAGIDNDVKIYCTRCGTETEDNR